DASGNLIIGTEPGGLILRVSPAGEGFVLYQAGKREVTAVGVARSGAIYAAAVGTKPAAPSGPSLQLPPVTVPTQMQPTGAGGGRGVQPAVSSPPSPPASVLSITGGTEVYRIDRDNYPRKVWSHPSDIAYALGFDAEDHAIIGT